METDGIASALEHCAFQIVVEQRSRHATPRREGRFVATQEISHARIEVEAQEDLARVAQHHHEGHQSALGPAEGEPTKVRPVHLGLLAWQAAKAQIRLGLRPGPIVGNQMTKVVGAAAEAALSHHGVEPAGGEARVALEYLAHKGQIGIDQRGTMRPHAFGQPRLGEHSIDGAMVHPELPGDGADRPLLHMEVAQDLRFELRGNRQRRLLLSSMPSRATLRDL
jgi:hypothetical protein